MLDCVNNHSDRTPCLDAHLPPVVAVLAASATLQVASAGPWLSPPSVAFATTTQRTTANVDPAAAAPTATATNEDLRRLSRRFGSGGA